MVDVEPIKVLTINFLAFLMTNINVSPIEEIDLLVKIGGGISVIIYTLAKALVVIQGIIEKRKLKRNG